MRELAADGEAVSLSRIGEQMNADYGFASLKKLIASTERVELLEGGKARLRKRSNPPPRPRGSLAGRG
ncbi:MAG: hypothetical protein WDN06_03275 [Asticcacaulis sp.]